MGKIYNDALAVINKALAHNKKWENRWPWKEREISSIIVRANVVLDIAVDKKQHMRICASNLARIGNTVGANYYTLRAEQYDKDANVASEVLNNIDSWHRLPKILL